jgi:ABC-2 type transport system ATP-binding protein
MSVIAVSHLTCDYGAGKGVFDLSLEVNEGEIFGFLGPNGAGKTTTIRHLLGFIRPRQGSCLVAGLDCWAQAPDVQKKLGYIPGEMAFFEQMTGQEYLRFVQSYRKVTDNQRTKQLMERFELDASSPIRKMSKGMKQKVGIVAAFMHDPAILILDEPTSGLDPLMQNRFVELLLEEKKRGKTVLMSSHMFEEVDRTCDRIGMIRAGKLVAMDTAQALREKHVATYTVLLENAAKAAAFARDFGGRQDGENPKMVTVSARQTLEELFLHYYKEEIAK